MNICPKAACCLRLLAKLDGTSNCNNCYSFPEIQADTTSVTPDVLLGMKSPEPFVAIVVKVLHMATAVYQTRTDCFLFPGGITKKDGWSLRNGGYKLMVTCFLFKKLCSVMFDFF